MAGEGRRAVEQASRSSRGRVSEPSLLLHSSDASDSLLEISPPGSAVLQSTHASHKIAMSFPGAMICAHSFSFQFLVLISTHTTCGHFTDACTLEVGCLAQDHAAQAETGAWVSSPPAQNAPLEAPGCGAEAPSLGIYLTRDTGSSEVGRKGQTGLSTWSVLVASSGGLSVNVGGSSTLCGLQFSHPPPHLYPGNRWC